MANILNWRDQVKFNVGDTLRVHQTVREGDKSRTQIFEGIVLRIKGHDGLKSFTVRKIATGGIGVERIFPEVTPTVVKIEVVKKGKVRRANLGYLRDRIGKKATKVKDNFVKGVKQEVEETVTKNEPTTEEEVMAKRASRVAKEEKMSKKAEKAVKEKKKTKKKAKIVRKEKVFVR